MSQVIGLEPRTKIIWSSFRSRDRNSMIVRFPGAISLFKIVKHRPNFSDGYDIVPKLSNKNITVYHKKGHHDLFYFSRRLNMSFSYICGMFDGLRIDECGRVLDKIRKGRKVVNREYKSILS